MKEIKDMTLDEIKTLEEDIKVAKKALKDSVKANKADVESARVQACNDAIKNGTLKQGSNVVILYKGKEVTALVATAVTADRTSITCHSLDFDGKVDDKGQKRRYIEKRNFVRVA